MPLIRGSEEPYSEMILSTIPLKSKSYALFKVYSLWISWYIMFVCTAFCTVLYLTFYMVTKQIMQLFSPNLR